MISFPENFWGKFDFLDPNFNYLLLPLFGILFGLWLLLVSIEAKLRLDPLYGSKSPPIGKTRFWGFFAIPAGILMVLALARPYLPGSSTSFSRGGIELILVVDRSISMRGNDLQPDRLSIAKREALGAISLLNERDKLALFVFGRESHRKVYLTDKHEAVVDRLSNVFFPESLTGDALIWDSDFASMLENIYRSMDRQDIYFEGYRGLNYKPKSRSNRIVVLITDGEDQFRKMKTTATEEFTEKAEYEKRIKTAFGELRRRGLKVYPVGIGTRSGVSWSSLLRDYKEGADYPKGMLEAWKGRFSRIDRDNLLFIARSTGAELDGQVWTIERSTTTARNYLKYILDSNRSSMPEFSSGEDQNQLWQYFLEASIVFIVVGILVYPFSGYFRKNKALR